MTGLLECADPALSRLARSSKYGMQFPLMPMPTMNG